MRGMGRGNSGVRMNNMCMEKRLAFLDASQDVALLIL